LKTDLLTTENKVEEESAVELHVVVEGFGNFYS
jgi:hypothetical protein